MAKKRLRTIFYLDYRVNFYIRLIANKSVKLNILKKCLSRHIRKKYMIIIRPDTSIGHNILFPHPQNIVIGSKCKIGNNCIIYQDVTIGQNKDKYPTIGNNVIIYTGAKIIGNINIGNNVIVGANSLVIKDVEDNTIVGGVPAKFIKKRGTNNEYH